MEGIGHRFSRDPGALMDLVSDSIHTSETFGISDHSVNKFLAEAIACWPYIFEYLCSTTISLVRSFTLLAPHNFIEISTFSRIPASN